MVFVSFSSIEIPVPFSFYVSALLTVQIFVRNRPDQNLTLDNIITHLATAFPPFPLILFSIFLFHKHPLDIPVSLPKNLIAFSPWQ